MSKSFKYVSDFSFPADCGFTGSAGKTSVKGYSRGGPMQKAAGGKVGANRPVQQAAVKPAPQQPNQPSPRMQPPGPQRPNQPPPRMQPPGPQRPNQPPPRMQPPAAPPPPQAAVKPAPQQPNQPMPQVMPRVEQQSPLTQVAQNAQPQRPNQPMPQVQSPMPQMPRNPWDDGRGGTMIGAPPPPPGTRPTPFNDGTFNSNDMPQPSQNPFNVIGGLGGMLGNGPAQNNPMSQLFGQQQNYDPRMQQPFNPQGTLGNGPPQNNPAAQIFRAQQEWMFGPQRPPSNPIYESMSFPPAQSDATQNFLNQTQPINVNDPYRYESAWGASNSSSAALPNGAQNPFFGLQQTQQPLQPPQPNQAQQSPMGPVGGLQQLQGQQAQPAPQQASLQPQTPPTLAPTAMKRGGGVKAPMKKADGGMIERESVRFIPMSNTAKFSKAIGRGSLPSMIRGVARDMALSGFEEEGRLALDEARAARASQLTEERAPPRARSQGLRSPVAEMARERALMGENAGYKKGGMAMRKQYPTNRSEPMIAMKKGGAAPKSDMLFSKKEVNATNLLRDGKGAPMPHPKGSVNMAKGGMTAKRQAKK